MHQQLSHIAVAPFTDPEQSILSTRTMLARRKPNRRGKVTSFGEPLTVTQRTGKCAGSEWTDTAQFQ